MATGDGTGGAEVTAALDALGHVPGVAVAVEEARQACTALRWHPALRRRTAECRAEALVRAARASAALDGARVPVDLVRDAARGERGLPADATGLVVRGALRASTEAQGAASDGVVSRGGSWQLVARLHVAAAAGLVDDDALGRPRHPGEPPLDAPPGVVAPDGLALTARLDALAGLLAAEPRVPALLVAALAHAEVLTARPFVAGNGVVARALARALVVGRGLDATGVAVPEAAHLADTGAYTAAWAAYAEGTPGGVATWLRHCAWAVVTGAGEGSAIADAVRAGRPGG